MTNCTCIYMCKKVEEVSFIFNLNYVAVFAYLYLISINVSSEILWIELVSKFRNNSDQKVYFVIQTCSYFC